MKITAGSTSRIARVFIGDSRSGTGAGLTGLVYNSGSLTAYYIREGSSSATAISLVTATVGTYTSSGFKEVDSTNMPGVYELGLPNAAIASGAKSVTLYLQGAANMVPVVATIELDAVDYQNATSFGLSNLDAAITSRSTLTQSQVTGGAYSLQTDGSGYVKLSNGTGTGQLNISSGVVAANATQIASSAAAATALTYLYQGTGTVGGVPSSTEWDHSGLSLDEYSGQGAILRFTSGANEGEYRQVDQFTATSMRVNHAMGSIPSAGDTFILLVSPQDIVGSVASVVGNVGGNVTGNVGGDVQGKVLGGGGATITGTGVRAVDSSGNAIATATQNAAATRTELATELARIDANISTRSTYAGTDTSGTTTLLSRITGTRAGYIDNLSAGVVPTASQIAEAARDVSNASPAANSVGADIASAKSNSSSASSTATAIATILSGITSLANWLRAGFRSSTPNGTALTEINSGGGTYDATTDSQEAIATTAVTARTVVLPVYATSGNGDPAPRDFIISQNSAPTLEFTCLDSAGEPIDLSGASLRFVACTKAGDTLTTIFTVSGTITVSGADDNVVSVPITSTHTATAREVVFYFLWRTSDNLQLAKGKITMPAANLS